jgi:hypothetical protein
LLPDTEIEFVRNAGRKAFRFDDRPVRVYVPHHNHDRDEPGAALANGARTNLARFYFPMVKFLEFARGARRCGNVNFDLFEIPDAELARLNELIDGTIEIIEFDADAP